MMDRETLLPTNASPTPSSAISIPSTTSTSTSSSSRKFAPSTPPSNLFSLPGDAEAAPAFSPLKERLIFGPSSSFAAADDDTNPFASTASSSLPTTSTSSSDDSWLLDSSVTSRWKTNLHRSVTAPAMATLNEIIRPQKADDFPARPSIVGQAFVLLLVYLAFGVAIYSFNRANFSATETNPVVDALYFCIVTMCTIGYGDITPVTASAKLFSITFVLVGFGLVDILLSGMVSYVLDLQESLLLSAVKKPPPPEKEDDSNDNNHHHHHRTHHYRRDIARRYIVDLKKGRMRVRMKVALALGVVLLCIAVGAFVLRFVEQLCWLDAFYLSVMSVTTVGYGDRAFKTLPGRLFASMWLLVSTLAVARAFLYLAEARIDRRHRKIANFVLCRDMTVSEFLEADIDHHGFITKSEFVVYKLKEMGKVSEKDIMAICHQFDRLDTGKNGKIRLSVLIESHH